MLQEFERIAERGGVLGAMETGYQRGRIQDESMHYEMLKHTGELPIIGVNTFRNPKGDPIPEKLELARSTEEEKQSQLSRLHDFHARNADVAPAMLQRLTDSAVALRLLQNPGIIRHRGKIESTINNAGRVADLVDEFGSLSNFVWRFEPDPASRPADPTPPRPGR